MYRPYMDHGEYPLPIFGICSSDFASEAFLAFMVFILSVLPLVHFKLQVPDDLSCCHEARKVIWNLKEGLASYQKAYLEYYCIYKLNIFITKIIKTVNIINFAILSHLNFEFLLRVSKSLLIEISFSCN